MKTYQIDIERKGQAPAYRIVESLLNIRAVLVLCFRQEFGKEPRHWWAAKSGLDMGEASSWKFPKPYRRLRSPSRAPQRMQIRQIHSPELRELELYAEAQERLEKIYATPLLTERRAA